MILLDAFALPVSVIGLALLFAHRQDRRKRNDGLGWGGPGTNA